MQMMMISRVITMATMMLTTISLRVLSLSVAVPAGVLASILTGPWPTEQQLGHYVTTVLLS